MTKKASLLIFAQSLIATLGSLYYSYFGDPVVNAGTGDLFNMINGLNPCELCRRARVLMYPIVIISAVGLWQKSTSYIKYVLPMSILGVLLESYHYLLQKFAITTSFTCTFSQPCNALEVDYFGFVTIPLLCLIAFIIITIAARTMKTTHHS